MAIRSEMLNSGPANSVVVLDFETTGLSPNLGDRAIEVGAVKIREGAVIDRFQQVMNPGFRISSFIEQYTGITNQMIRKAAPCGEVMASFADFIGDSNLVAHNAAFDLRFLESELRLIGRPWSGAMACSLLVARRIYPQAPNHQLGSLVAYRQLQAEAAFHRALADSEMTARLWLRMISDICDQYQLPPLTFHQMVQLSRKPKASARSYLEKCRAN